MAMLNEDFASAVLPFDSQCVPAYVHAWQTRRALGQPASDADLQIAAIALTYDLPLVTRTANDFDGLGLELINPWISAA